MKLKRQFALRLLLNSAIIILVVFFTLVIYSGSDVQDVAAAVTEDTIVTFQLEHCDCKRCLSAFSSHQMQGEAAMRSISLWN